MKWLPILLMVCMSSFARADVFKCTNMSGKVVYQSSICQGEAKERRLVIKSPSIKEPEFNANTSHADDWEDDYNQSDNDSVVEISYAQSVEGAVKINTGWEIMDWVREMPRNNPN